ncbi:MAG: outer membrane protein [Cyanobacteriota bacterium]|jgi:opacity protein-like surface antigen
MSSLRNALVRGFGAALAGGALLTAPSFAGTQTGAQQLQPSGEAPLEMSQSSQKDAQIAQTYIPLVGEVGSASVQGTGFYVTVGAGAAWAGNWDFQDNLDDYNFDGNINTIGGFSIDAGIGYDFGAIRTELTYGFARASLNKMHFNNHDTFDGSGNIDKNDVLASVYLDIPFGQWVPYIGGGIGYSNLSTPGFTVDGERFSGSNQGLFGWQAKAGVAYAMNWNTDIYVEGTYSGASGFDSGALDYSSFNNWGAKLGVRYRFGAPPVVVVEQPAPAPEPAPMPMPEPAPAPEPAPIRGLW